MGVMFPRKRYVRSFLTLGILNSRHSKLLCDPLVVLRVSVVYLFPVLQSAIPLPQSEILQNLSTTSTPLVSNLSILVSAVVASSSEMLLSIIFCGLSLPDLIRDSISGYLWACMP